jgi:hypothetical protein
MVKQGSDRSVKFSAKHDPTVIMYRLKALRNAMKIKFAKPSEQHFYVDENVRLWLKEFPLPYGQRAVLLDSVKKLVWKWQDIINDKTFYPVTEDFSTYTKIDPNNHILNLVNNLDFQAYNNETAYLCKDKGIDYFSSFTHEIQVMVKSSVVGNPWTTVWGLANEIGDFLSLQNFLSLTIYCGYGDPALPWIGLYEWNGIDWNGGLLRIDYDKWYYLRIIKTETQLTMEIYSDFNRTVLVNSQSFPLMSSIKYRYIYACASWNLGTSDFLEASTTNLCWLKSRLEVEHDKWIDSGLPEQLFLRLASKNNEVLSLAKTRLSHNIIVSFETDVFPYPEEYVNPQAQDYVQSNEIMPVNTETYTQDPWRQNTNKYGDVDYLCIWSALGMNKTIRIDLVIETVQPLLYEKTLQINCFIDTPYQSPLDRTASLSTSHEIDNGEDKGNDSTETLESSNDNKILTSPVVSSNINISYDTQVT